MAKNKNKRKTNHINRKNISQYKEATSNDKTEDPIRKEDVLDNTYNSKASETTENHVKADGHEQASLKEAQDEKPDLADDEAHPDEAAASDEEADKAVVSDEEAHPDQAVASEEEMHEGSTSDIKSDVDEEALRRKKKRRLIIRGLRILFTIGFFIFVALFINETVIQPYKLKKSNERARNLYHYEEVAEPTKEPEKVVPIDNSENNQIENSDTDPQDMVTPTPTPDPNRDEMGRLKKFANLLEVNEDVKGWIRIDNINGENDTKIDYVVLQSDASDPEYYLDRRWDTHEYLKAGSIFLDSTSSVEGNSKNLIIHGHNMTSSDDMFHYLLNYNELDYLKEHPLISFDTIYEEAMWKIFSVYITPGTNERDDFFPYVKSDFATNRDFLEYIYQIRVRSLFQTDDIDINEDDQILTLSTCSYELSQYRTIIVARKVRDGEDPLVNTENFRKKDKKEVLYAPSYYWRYGGKAPKIPTFDVALEDGLIPWYSPMGR